MERYRKASTHRNSLVTRDRARDQRRLAVDAQAATLKAESEHSNGADKKMERFTKASAYIGRFVATYGAFREMRLAAAINK